MNLFGISATVVRPSLNSPVFVQDEDRGEGLHSRPRRSGHLSAVRQRLQRRKDRTTQNILRSHRAISDFRQGQQHLHDGCA